MPELLTVEEAAGLLRIGRTKAYAMTQEWRATNGASGLPVVDLGHALRVVRRDLERMLGTEIPPSALAEPDAEIEPKADRRTPRGDATTAAATVGHVEARVPHEVVSQVSPSTSGRRADATTSASGAAPSRRMARRPRRTDSPSQLGLFDPAPTAER